MMALQEIIVVLMDVINITVMIAPKQVQLTRTTLTLISYSLTTHKFQFQKVIVRLAYMITIVVWMNTAMNVLITALQLIVS